MQRLRTSFSRPSAGDVGVSNLEKVASLPVQAGEQGDESGPEDVTRELAAAASMADMPHELRRQLYHEAHAFRHSPLFTQKVRMENKMDEHELLRVQLEALDYQEQNGVLLTEGDFYYRYPQSFDPSARPRLDGGDGQPEWSSLKQQLAPGPTLSVIPQTGGQAGALYGTPEAETQNQWQSWLQRQRKRGWYTSTTLVYSTLFGAVVGASNFTTYWQQLQIWRSSMFLLPYLLFLFTVGLPTLQLELVLGNLLRGAAIKQNTQLSRWLVGLGILQVLTSVSFVILTAVVSSQLLIYFLSSFSRPQPWQVTVSDMELCNSFHGKSMDCNAAGHGVLCSYVPDASVCIASPTGKATLYYLQELQPSTVNPDLDPDLLRPKALATLAFVWLYILAYMWRGLFKAGFPSSILMIIAMVLCATLAVVSFFVGADGGVHVAAAVTATFDWRPLIHGFFDAAYSASLVRHICQDLCLGCCIIGTITSYTKIGFNTYPGGLYTCILEFVMAFVPFVSLLSIVGNLQAVTDIPLVDIVRKTGSAPAYFVVFPAAFEKVSSPYLFGLFFYGGVFLINTQVAAIAVHSVFNAVLESRVINNNWRRATSTVIVIICYCISLPFCANNQQVRLEYIVYIVEWLLVPISVLCTTFYVGWVMGFQQQSKVVGLKACILFGGLCLIVGASYIIAVFCHQETAFLPIWIMVFANAVIAIVVALLVKDPDSQAKTFKERFLALYLGGVQDLGNEISRVTLFFPQHTIGGTSVLGVIPTLFCGCLTKPFFIFRPSTFWCVCIKHLVPVVMLVSIVDACQHFDIKWESMQQSPNMRNLGAALLGMGAAFLLVTPFLPKVRDWVRPVEEDYMSTSAFPSHPFVPWRRVTPFSLIPALFREHLARSKEPAASVKSLMLDYKKQKLPFMPSFAREGGAGRSEAEFASQHQRRHERSSEVQTRKQPGQPLSFASKSSESSETSHHDYAAMDATAHV
ncbi:sodium- and chloride-dependent betaine transporter [Cyclospora cayetanensis]|uniref:Sodium- and chloride-dependent betaine transporter n=1 Tax=Cyclospora cayetanensis TaxID=88456 RepID=A0A6P6RWS2_9EIME|nr:sodium- and chloride-dependent betaine transporter [Cyclospora cayetanensis]